MFFNVNASREFEPRSLHAGLPPASGQKWLLSQMGAQPPLVRPLTLAVEASRPNLTVMSRAFVKEADENQIEELPERPVSSAPNYVTVDGFAAIEAEIARLGDELAQAGEDRAERARIGRDLRYWSARRGSAHIVPARADVETVHFGSTVTIDRDDGRHQVFRIVGEDEADPEKGTISHVSPLARALLGKGVGESVNVAGHAAGIAEIS